MAKEDILEEKFISRILQEEGQEMFEATTKVMRSANFSSEELLNDRSISGAENRLIYTHRPEHRFVDMSSRNTKKGKIRKVSHAIHNKILFGRANTIVHRLSFEYTSGMREMLLKDFPKNI